jgi:hypothetical protein
MSGGHSNLLATAKSRAIQQNIFNHSHLEGAMEQKPAQYILRDGLWAPQGETIGLSLMVFSYKRPAGFLQPILPRALKVIR